MCDFINKTGHRAIREYFCLNEKVKETKEFKFVKELFEIYKSGYGCAAFFNGKFYIYKNFKYIKGDYI